MTRSPTIRRLLLAAALFVALAVGFVVSVAVLHRWGPGWTQAAYAPLLGQRVAEARAVAWYGKAERLLTRAVQQTPAYGGLVLDLAGGDLRVMPALRHALRNTSAAGAPGVEARVTVIMEGEEIQAVSGDGAAAASIAPRVPRWNMPQPPKEVVLAQAPYRRAEARLAGKAQLSGREAFVLAASLAVLRGVAPEALLQDAAGDPVAHSAACTGLGRAAEARGEVEAAALWYARALRQPANPDGPPAANRVAAARLTALAGSQDEERHDSGP
jgi:hypothetical protein